MNAIFEREAVRKYTNEEVEEENNIESNNNINNFYRRKEDRNGCNCFNINSSTELEE